MQIGNPVELGFSKQRLSRIEALTNHAISEGQIAGIDVLVARRGRIAFRFTGGKRDIAAGEAIEPDTLYRIYSMTKPITSAAVMLLVEEARVRLTDPISKFFPEFGEMEVYQSGTQAPFATVPSTTPITIRHLLTHTAGLGYGIGDQHPVEKHIEATLLPLLARDPEVTLADLARELATFPLLHQPGTAWRYSLGIDVLGAIIEQVSGSSFAEFLQERLFVPLGMADTFFTVPEAKRPRLGPVYTRTDTGLEPQPDSMIMAYTRANAHPNGGGGLVSTTSDYLAFAQMLLDGGRAPDSRGGDQILSPRTIDVMIRPHVAPDTPGWQRPGLGFGYGGSVVCDPDMLPSYATRRRFGWGGAAGTRFWVEPEEQLLGIVMIQLMPPETSQVVDDIQTTIWQAIVE